jgi:hypothetical protein
LVATRTTHQPFPEHAVDTMIYEAEDVEPCSTWKNVLDKPSLGAGEQPFINRLQIIKEDRLLSITPVNMAKDMQTRLNAPQLTKEVWAAKI